MATPSAVLAVIRAAQPQLRNGADAVAFALHAALCCEGFVLVAVDDAAQQEPVDGGATVHEVGLDGWNASPDEYTFRYVVDGAAPTYVLKALTAGAKLLVDAAPPPPGQVAHLELRCVRVNAPLAVFGS